MSDTIDLVEVVENTILDTFIGHAYEPSIAVIHSTAEAVLVTLEPYIQAREREAKVSAMRSALAEAKYLLAHNRETDPDVPHDDWETVVWFVKQQFDGIAFDAATNKEENVT